MKARFWQTESLDHKKQQLAALQLANEARRARAQLKRQIADGTVSAAEILLDPPDVAGTSPWHSC